MTTVLLTGFEPFGGDARNPSEEAVAEVGREWSGPETLVTAALPVAFDAAAEELRRLVVQHAPDLVIATGLAGGRDAVTPERVAINLRDARIPDNAGQQPADAPCVEGGPAAYFSSLPVKAIVRAIADDGIPASLSHTAGTFVCNHVFYAASGLAAAHPGLRAGFIHVPWSTETVPDDSPALPTATIARALALALRAALDSEEDLAVPAGTLH
ncbi:pyroglutamyl-peptidase I [Microbacterium betulae]|uniref:Pyrrolidone-carboxylate peptidase n=1 Tax=Microbacterium betulae TaxID=2981139 RepID=A0AA97I410_9MICO|nr:pyroglutamyl-peptidase I [Microbacterium sp. AB]WOF22081.1 pyroglutamyl-peptidase I [Microbacterium sp. AB]